MKTIQLTTPVSRFRFPDELSAAIGDGLVVVRLSGPDDGATGEIVVQDSVLDATVQAVIDAHDPTPPTLRQLAVAAFQDAQAEAALRDRAIVLALVDQLNVIGQKHDALLTWLGGQAGLTNKAALAGFALPDNIQPTQAKATIEAKIEAGGAD